VRTELRISASSGRPTIDIVLSGQLAVNCAVGWIRDMPNTPFQNEWNNIATRWGLSIEAPFVVEIAGSVITVPVLLRDFGATRGMLLVTDFRMISPYADGLIDLGYGFSCLSEPTGEAHPDDDEALMEMLTDWGWSGKASPPAWYREPTS